MTLEVPLKLVLAGSVTIFAYLYSIRNFKWFEKSGIHGPAPWPVIGSAMNFYGECLMDSDMKLRRQYGKFVGMFEGTLPVLMVYDAQWLKEAFVKNFEVFKGRKKFKSGSILDEGILSLEGRLASQCVMFCPISSSTPHIGEAFLLLMPPIQKCNDAFVEILKGFQGEPVDIRQCTNLLTLDVISQTAFGLDTKSQSRKDNEYVKHAFSLLSETEAVSSLRERIRLAFAVTVFMFTPQWVQSVLAKFVNTGMFNSDAIRYFEALCDQIIGEKEYDSDNSSNFVQAFNGKIVEAPKNHPDTLVDSSGFNWSKQGPTKREIIGNALLFMFAGFQTTAGTILYLFYELAHHPDIQQQLYKDICNICDTEAITMEQISQLYFLEYCLNETMRLYPQGARFDRMACEDVTVGGLFIPKGTCVTASTWVIHRDPEVWENPESFEPNRFAPERLTTECSTAFIPFGIGDRHCIGRHLALTEIKMTMISVLKAFRIEKDEQTPERPLQFKKMFAMIPEKKIMLRFTERSENMV